jgi:hypothetical protein
MLRAEARWYGRRLRALPKEALYPQLNLGSQTLTFRTQVQPWIDEQLFAPARRRGGLVVHCDLQHAEGVDLVGDLTDPAFLAELQTRRFRSLICSNLLEHVVQPERIARAAAAAVVPGGYLFVSVPFQFPYHADPIDTLFRPSPQQLAALFPGTVLEEARLVRGTLLGYLLERLIRQPRGLWTGRNTHEQHSGTASLIQKLNTWLPWLWRPFEISCVVLRKQP